MKFLCRPEILGGQENAAGKMVSRHFSTCSWRIEMKFRRILVIFLAMALVPVSVFSADDPKPANKVAPRYYEQGRAQVTSGNWDEAIQMFQKAVQQDSRDYKALNMLGYSLRQTGKYKEAIEAYNRALSIKPDYAQALEYRGKAYLGAGNKQAALADYKKLVSLKSNLAEDLKAAIDKAK